MVTCSGDVQWQKTVNKADCEHWENNTPSTWQDQNRSRVGVRVESHCLALLLCLSPGMGLKSTDCYGEGRHLGSEQFLLWFHRPVVPVAPIGFRQTHLSPFEDTVELYICSVFANKTYLFWHHCFCEREGDHIGIRNRQHELRIAVAGMKIFQKWSPCTVLELTGKC